jgi:hypothetical protein
MWILLLCFVILAVSTTTNTQGVSDPPDSCSSNVQIAVPYTLWIGTNVTSHSSIMVQVPQYTAFYDVMKAAAIRAAADYRYVGRVSSLAELGGYPVDLGRFGHCHCVCHQDLRKYTVCCRNNQSFPEVKGPGRGADHPPPSSAEVKKE